MPGRVEGKVAFITGAARGQGRSHAVRLAEEGADIIAVDVCQPIETVAYEASTPDDLAETARLVEKQGQRVVTAEVDVRNFDALHEVLQKGVRELGRLDIVCANAGILSLGMAHEQTEQQWQTMVDINLTGVWHTTKAATPTLIQQGTGGSIILTSSMAGLKGSMGIIGYAAAKWGVVGMAKSLALELAPYRIRVNAINPTNVNTPMLDSDMMRKVFRPDLDNPTFDEAKEAYASIHAWPMPWIEPVDVSNAVLYLGSDEGRYVTGAALPVDLAASAK